MVDLVPEAFKALTGKSRYESLVANIQGLSMLLDGVKSLIKTYEPPTDQIYSATAKIEDAIDAHQQAAENLAALHRRVRTFEAELIAKQWKVT